MSRMTQPGSGSWCSEVEKGVPVTIQMLSARYFISIADGIGILASSMAGIGISASPMS